jgi:Flp pilus assembly protein TadD
MKLIRIAAVGVLLLSVAACAGTGQPVQTNTAATPSINVAGTLSAADATRLDGRFTEAAELYQQVLVADPKSSAAQYGMAECLLATNRPNEAKTIFEALVGNPQVKAAALQGLGLSDLSLNQREPAAKALREAIDADPTQWRALNGLALIADLKRQGDEAADLYDKALKLNPDSVMLLNNRGYSNLSFGKTDAAITDFRKALALDPDSETVQNNLRIAIAAKGNYADATRNVAKANLPIVLNNVGYVAMKRGDFAQAETYLSRAMEANPAYDATVAKNLDQLSGLKGTTP